MFILVFIQHTQVPLLQRDAMDHNEVVQMMLRRCGSYWDPSSLGGVAGRGDLNKTGGRNMERGPRI